ncbi:hypothetical protein Smp_159210 [Schistosoma mansoni]|uniref:hypothetical protein n=1 Tax=Schistosoma mansoni TaxID=6183 RepID=UPI00022DBFB2|nr:hypothetical protein Smp_159210 [Schistosoma mansoni]|eukprot:XP_018652755.1 hypothetical protein Smp_159210 [Schistosoma mansoni]
MSGSLSNRYIQNDEISRYSDEWMLGTEGSISVNSSDIYINVSDAHCFCKMLVK